MTRTVDFKKASIHKTPEKSPGYLLWRVSTLWRRSIEDVLKPLQLTHPQFVILAVTGWLTQSGAIANQSDIGKQASLDPNTTSQILRGLQAKGLIERKQSEHEKSKKPVLTPAGAKLLVKALAAVEKADVAFFSPLNIKKSSLLKDLNTLSI